MAEDKDFDALLDEFISQQLADAEDKLAELDEVDTGEYVASQEDDEAEDEENDEEYVPLSAYAEEDEGDGYQLAEDERRLYNSYKEFIEAVENLAAEKGIEVPAMYFTAEDLQPRFSPYRADNLKSDILQCWDVMIAAEPQFIAKLPPNPDDEQILNFAEKISAPNLQLSLISYVETLIETDACENAYNLRKVKYQKHQIEKELYEEQQRFVHKKQLYAKAIKEKCFPVDADLLVSNFFKAAGKDPENAAKLLERNPAIFAPIQIDKIPDKFFGLIKAKPSDGKVVNRKLGKFLASLKV